MSSLLRLYKGLVDKHPFFVPVITAGVLSSCGDVLAQRIEIAAKPKPFSYHRTAVMGSLGLCFFGPICSTSLRLLHFYKFRPIPSVVVDQLVTSPIINTGFVLLHPFLSGSSWKEVKERFFEVYTNVQTRSWLVWVPVQVVNFLFVPYQFRLLFIQTVALFWNTFLSYRANLALIMSSKSN